MLSGPLPGAPLYAWRRDGAVAPYLGVHYPSDSPRARCSATRWRAGGARAVKVGIVGLPNAGKSSLFNALTRAGAQAANYPFTTVEPNVAVVPVPDERLDRVVATVRATPDGVRDDRVPRHRRPRARRAPGEGLGNQFLGNIRETDAHPARGARARDAQVVHPEGRVDPLADVDAVETELLYADLEQAERRLERVAARPSRSTRWQWPRRRWLREVVEALRRGRPVRTVPLPGGGARRRCRASSRSRPSRCSTWPTWPRASRWSRRRRCASTRAARGARAAAVCARLEAELAELDDEEAAAMREELGVAESGLATVIREAFALLGLISFFTAGEGKEARAHGRSRRGTPPGAPPARSTRTSSAASWPPRWCPGATWWTAGGYAAARERAKMRVEGRDYEMRDGDVVTFRFTP